MKKLNTRLQILSVVFLIATAAVGCDEDCKCGCGDDCNGDCKECECSPEDQPITPDAEIYKTGYMIDKENVGEMEQDLNLSYMLSASDYYSLPASYDLTEYLPPIGDQGDYGTCVAWAVGYNTRTYSRAQAMKITNLSNPHEQFSPKYLFLAIDNVYKPNKCDGTYFESALDALMYEGCATMATVPYKDLGDCYQGNEKHAQEEAANYKIIRYRTISNKNLTKELVKDYLAKNKMVMFGANVGEAFMRWRGDGVFKNDSWSLGGHAMVVCGYDDHKGSNGAFRIANSWGTGWGDNGYIWIDQDYFVNAFAKYAFVMDTDDKPVVIDPDKPDPVEDVTTGFDLAALNLDFVDYNKKGDPDSDNPLWRNIKFNAYNAGSNDVPSSKNWFITCMYYNAYDAKDYGFLEMFLFTDKYGKQGEWDGNWTDKSQYGNPTNEIKVESEGYGWANFDIPSGRSVSESFGWKGFSWPVLMPEKLTGDYYIVLTIDPFNAIQDDNRDNNTLVFAASNGNPIRFNKGIPVNISKSSVLKSVVEKKPNSYTQEEISQLVNLQLKNGTLQKKAKQWMAKNPSKVTVKNITENTEH